MTDALPPSPKPRQPSQPLTFITNINRHDAVLIRDKRWPTATIGEPKAVHRFTVKDLKDMGYVGLWWEARY